MSENRRGDRSPLSTRRLRKIVPPDNLIGSVRQFQRVALISIKFFQEFSQGRGDFLAISYRRWDYPENIELLVVRLFCVCVCVCGVLDYCYTGTFPQPSVSITFGFIRGFHIPSLLRVAERRLVRSFWREFASDLLTRSRAHDRHTALRYFAESNSTYIQGDRLANEPFVWAPLSHPRRSPETIGICMRPVNLSLNGRERVTFPDETSRARNPPETRHHIEFMPSNSRSTVS